MIEKKTEMYPTLAKVEIDIRGIAAERGPDSESLYKGFMDNLADVAMKEHVHLIIH